MVVFYIIYNINVLHIKVTKGEKLFYISLYKIT